MSDDILIATLDVAALAVGQGDFDAGTPALPAMADFTQLSLAGNPAPFISQSVLGGSQPFADGTRMARGIHLHWSLPRQLTRGQVKREKAQDDKKKDEDKGLAFPSVPDRWLVTRILLEDEGPPKLRSWVVESDRLSTQAIARTGPPQPNILYRDANQSPQVGWLGESFPTETWQENAEARRAPRPFTALGYGEPSFAAFYPNCASVFGFHDALDGVPDTASLSYVINGWYANEEEDPLHAPSATTLADWQVPPGSQPGRLVCSGMIDGIDWQVGKRYLDQSAQPLTVAIASTSREALSALLARNAGIDDAETLLNALQFGLLAGADNHTASARDFEQAVHDAGFASLSGGTSWNVERAEDKELGGKTVELPAAQARLLSDLNALQNQQNEDERKCLALRTQLFLDWQKYQMLAHGPADPGNPLAGRLEELRALLRSQSAAIALQVATLNQGRAAIAQAGQALRAQLAEPLELRELTGAPRFYQPAEPVLLLAGKDVQPPARHAPDVLRSKESDTRLASRLFAVTVSTPFYSGYMPLRAVSPGQMPLPAQMPLAPVLRGLVAQALSTGPTLQNRLTASMNQAGLDIAGSLQFQGSAPPAAYCQSWATPWLPFLLHYEIELSPLARKNAQAGFAEGFIRDNFRFGFDAMELELSGTPSGDSRLYRASTLLAADATLGIAREIERYQKQSGGSNKNLGSLLEHLDQLPLLAQNLTGFNDALLMQRAALQLAVDDPQDAVPQAGLIETVRLAVDSQKRLTPLPLESFNPLRAERLRISRLRLVDVFGRFKDYAQPEVVIAKGLQPSGKPAGNEAVLAPRITQPARLQFRWRAATRQDRESLDAADSGPVLGWVMPNHLDRSLMFHGADGRPLGELALVGDEVRWTCAPLGAFPYGSSLPTVFEKQPADLRNLATSLHNGGHASLLAAFLRKVELALRFCLPDQFAETAEQVVLSGQPLVLARASLSLELAGLPARSQSWTSLEATLANQDSADDAGLGQVHFPVRLGALNKMDDTLIGYWLDPGSASDFENFHAPYSVAEEAGNKPLLLKDEPIALRAADTALEVLLLLDPRGSVHASSGILPVKNIDIPPRHYADALASFQVTFDCLPVLSGNALSAPPSMVLPRVTDGAWHWISTDGSQWNSLVPNEVNAAKASLDFAPQQIIEGWLSVRRQGHKQD